jgi:hypothetical protein
MAEAVICYRARRQTVVASSTAVAEYISLFCTFQEGVWVISLAEDMQMPKQEALRVFEDN